MAEVSTDLLRRYSTVKSLLVAGFVDLDVIPRAAKLFPEIVFLEGEHGYLRFSVDEVSGWLAFEEVSSPSLPASLLGEPSVNPVLVDLSIYHLSEVGAVRFERASIYVNANLKENRQPVRALAFHRSGGEILLLDPLWTFGIRIGNEADLMRIVDETEGCYLALEIAL